MRHGHSGTEPKRGARNPYPAAKDMDSGLAAFAAPRNDRVGCDCTCFILLAKHEPSEVCVVSPQYPRVVGPRQARGRSADRRSGACAAPFRGPMTPARRRHSERRLASHADNCAVHASGTLASRRSTAGFVASGPARRFDVVDVEPSAICSRPLLVAEGGCPEPPGTCLQGNARDAASRPALRCLARTPSADGTKARVGKAKRLSNRRRALCGGCCACAVDACKGESGFGAAESAL
jgi:hypothetical protein